MSVGFNLGFHDQNRQVQIACMQSLTVVCCCGKNNIQLYTCCIIPVQLTYSPQLFDTYLHILLILTLILWSSCFLYKLNGCYSISCVDWLLSRQKSLTGNFESCYRFVWCCLWQLKFSERDISWRKGQPLKER